MTTERFDRMKYISPDYYEFSQVHDAIVTAWDSELGGVDTKNDDLQLQFRIVTATWGLKYWEQQMAMPTVLADSYEIRRSRALSKRRGVGQFSGRMIESMAEAYSGGDVQITFDAATATIKVKFVGTLGIPSNLDDLKAAIDTVIHAHLGIEYSFTYYLYFQLDDSTYDQVTATGKTYDEIYNNGVA